MTREQARAWLVERVATKARECAGEYFREDRNLRHRAGIEAYGSISAMEVENALPRSEAIRPATQEVPAVKLPEEARRETEKLRFSGTLWSYARK